MHIVSPAPSRKMNFLNHTNVGGFWGFYESSTPAQTPFKPEVWLGCDPAASLCSNKKRPPTPTSHSLHTNVLLPLVPKFGDDRSSAAVLRGELLILNQQQVKFYLSSISLWGYGAENCRQAAALMAHS